LGEHALHRIDCRRHGLRGRQWHGAGLKNLLTDLDASLTSSETTLTAAELSDLKTIAVNLNNGISTSPYLAYITNALTNGNAANATWTGGHAGSTALGNLAAGTSATQLSEPIGKWFGGTDLSSSQVAMSGYSTFSVSYAAVSNPLFGTNGPSMSDVNQGFLGAIAISYRASPKSPAKTRTPSTRCSRRTATTLTGCAST
jgi:hypothetical protein